MCIKRKKIYENIHTDKYPEYKKAEKEEVSNIGLVLQEYKDEYLVEREREKTIETKASTFMGFMFAGLGLIIPSIPLESILVKYFQTNKEYMHFITICGWSVVLLLAILSLVISFFILFKVFGIKGRPRLRLDNLKKMADEEMDSKATNPDDFRKELIDHYHLILCNWDKSDIEEEKKESMTKHFFMGKKNENYGKGLREINNTSADLFDEAVIFGLLGFVLLVLVTVAFRVIVIF